MRSGKKLTSVENLSEIIWKRAISPLHRHLCSHSGILYVLSHLQVPTRLGANSFRRRLFSKLYHCWQATLAVRWYWVTVSTKNKDQARDEEFHGRRSSHLEQFTSLPVICNSLPLDVCLTCEGALVRLTDSSASDDFMTRFTNLIIIIIISRQRMHLSAAVAELQNNTQCTHSEVSYDGPAYDNSKASISVGI